jgi:signal transduction histidine kinase/CHASE3 domain sensor protein
MLGLLRRWWSAALVRQKVWTVFLLVLVPLLAALAVHLSLVTQLRLVQEQRHQVVLAREQLHILRRIAVDIEDGFRGYLLTRQETFLTPLQEAGARLAPTVEKTLTLIRGVPDLTTELQGTSKRLTALLDSKRALIAKIQAGRADEVYAYVRAGKGLLLSDALRAEFHSSEDRLDRELERLSLHEAALAQRAFWGLLLAAAGGLILGLVGTRLLTRSITHPLAQLQRAVVKFGQNAESVSSSDTAAIVSQDEIGQLARSYEEMALRIKDDIQELETLNAIGHEINTIGPDGLDGVLRRITDRAAVLLNADLCLVMLRNDRMGCWVVEAASGGDDATLHKSVVLWEEFPVTVEAFTTRQPAFGDVEARPRVGRRSFFGESMLALPLLAQGIPFGVLVVVQKRRVPYGNWNLRLAKGFASEAAMALSNARLYEEVHRRGKDLKLRLRELEHLAEMLAHDLKAPGERMEALAAVLRAEYNTQLDERATRWLTLIEQNGRDLTERVEKILEVARVGGRHEAVEAVDPSVLISDILKMRAGELEDGGFQVEVAPDIPRVAGHRAYLRQVFDNLLSNAIKFSAGSSPPTIRIFAERRNDRVHISVADNGPGIPRDQHERVFEPFVRLNPGAFKGTGIGLTIVSRIVELYGGRVWVEPGRGRGCTITVALPVLMDLQS